MEHFFKPNRIYAVAGASTNPDKFGFKVFKWYHDRKLPATPINFRKETILETPSVETINDLVLPSDASDGVGLSVVTPPAVTKELLESISKNSVMNDAVKAIWLQPGTYDPEVLDLARKVVPIVIQDCVLVNGDRFLSKL